MKESQTLSAREIQPYAAVAVERFLRKAEVKRLLSCGNTSFWELTKAGGFPAPRDSGLSYPVWLESEVVAWMRSRAPYIATSAPGVPNASR